MFHETFHINLSNKYINIEIKTIASTNLMYNDVLVCIVDAISYCIEKNILGYLKENIEGTQKIDEDTYTLYSVRKHYAIVFRPGNLHEHCTK